MTTPRLDLDSRLAALEHHAARLVESVRRLRRDAAPPVVDPPEPEPPVDPPPVVEPPPRPRPEPRPEPEPPIVNRRSTEPAMAYVVLLGNMRRADFTDPDHDALWSWAHAQHPEDKVTPRWPKMAERIEKRARDTSHVAFGDDRLGNGPGGVGIPYGRWGWRRSSASIVLAHNELRTIIRTRPIYLDPAREINRREAYSLYRQSDQLKGYAGWAEIEKTLGFRPFDGSHMQRAVGAAQFLVEHTDSALARWYLQHFAIDAELALGLDLHPGDWYETKDEHGLWRSWNAPLHRRREWDAEQGYQGWFGRYWMHQAAFWHWMSLHEEEHGLRHPRRGHSAITIAGEFSDAIDSIMETHPFKGQPQHGCLQWGGGQTLDGLRARYPVAANMGRWTQCFESGGIGVPVLRMYEHHEIAEGYANWLGPHPWAIRLLDAAPGRAPGSAYRYGAGAVDNKPGETHHGWYNAWAPNDDRQRTPYIRFATLPLSPPDEAINGHWTLEDGPADYAGAKLLAFTERVDCEEGPA